MKRDMDLIRQILKQVEDRPAEQVLPGIEIEGRHVAEIMEHLQILEDAGLVAQCVYEDDLIDCGRLTWQGHEFMDLARNDTRWRKAKEWALQKTGGLSFALLLLLLEKLAKGELGDILGE